MCRNQELINLFNSYTQFAINQLTAEEVADAASMIPSYWTKLSALKSSIGSTQSDLLQRMGKQYAREVLGRHWMLEGGAIAALRRTLQFRKENDVEKLRAYNIGNNNPDDPISAKLQNVCNAANMKILGCDSAGCAHIGLEPTSAHLSHCGSSGCLESCIYMLERALVASESRGASCVSIAIDLRGKLQFQPLLFLLMNE